MVVGPGFGKSDGAFGAGAASSLARADVPVVIDADGLNAHAGRLEDLRGARPRRRSSPRTAASWRG